MSYMDDQDIAMQCFLLAGTLLAQSGAETYRVENTMRHMAYSQGFNNFKSFVTPTGIIFSAGSNYQAKIVEITKRSTDLEKISRVNSVSRSLMESKMTINEAYDTLLYIEKTDFALPTWVQVAFSAVASGCFLVLFQGVYFDIPATVLAGGFGYLAFVLFNNLTQVKFFSEFIASVFIGLIALIATNHGLGLEENRIIIGAVMPLVPGVPIANGVRDLMAGHFVSGLSKCAEACLTALAVGAGIASVLVF